MHRPCTFMCPYTIKISVSSFMGYLKGKSALMIPELEGKWNKAFWARGYYVATVGNVTEDAIKKDIQEQCDESKEEDGTAFERQQLTVLAASAFRACM